LASRDVVDDSNDVFRYPENKVSFVLDISELHKVTEENRQEIVKDIERLSRLLLKLHSEITTGKIKKEK
jgi:predicted acetyltransferase